MKTREFELVHEGKRYYVEVEFDTVFIDDSFDGHLGGVVHTFKDSHREPDPENWEIISCQDESGEEVCYDCIDGLVKSIWSSLLIETEDLY